MTLSQGEEEKPNRTFGCWSIGFLVFPVIYKLFYFASSTAFGGKRDVAYLYCDRALCSAKN